MRDLVRACLEVQGRAGIAPEDHAPIFSGEVEGILLPVVFSMGAGNGPVFLGHLRNLFRRRYLDQGDLVLDFALRIYPRECSGIEALRATAKEATA